MVREKLPGELLSGKNELNIIYQCKKGIFFGRSPFCIFSCLAGKTAGEVICMPKERKKRKENEREPEATGFVPFPAPYSPSGIYPMMPPVWPDPGLGFDLGGMESPEDREQDI